MSRLPRSFNVQRRRTGTFILTLNPPPGLYGKVKNYAKRLWPLTENSMNHTMSAAKGAPNRGCKAPLAKRGTHERHLSGFDYAF
jgi:hypothetical protein